MKARNSITSEDEKLANKQLRLKNQWNDIDWKEVEKLVNRLQIRITKAVKEGKWYLEPIRKVKATESTETRRYLKHSLCSLWLIRNYTID